MSPREAIAKLAEDLAQHEADTATLGYERKLMLVDQDAVRAIVRPQVIESQDEKQEESES